MPKMPTHIILLTMPLVLAILAGSSGSERRRVLEGSTSATSIPATCQGTSFPCDVSLSITDVEYLGGLSASDRFRVKLLLTSPSPCFSALGFGGLGPQSLFSADFAVSVKVTRRLGHTDTGFESANRSITGAFSIDVKVPRGTLETDPVTVEANVNTTVTLKSAIEAHVAGTGIPTFNGPQSSNASGNTAQCYPSVTIAGVNYVQGSGAQKDTVTVNWTVAQPQSSCMKLTNVTATAKLKRTDGSTGTATSGGNGTATLQVSGNPGNVASFDVSVKTEAASGPNITASAKKIKNL
jgi:hypothetical protein